MCRSVHPGYVPTNNKTYLQPAGQPILCADHPGYVPTNNKTYLQPADSRSVHPRYVPTNNKTYLQPAGQPILSADLYIPDTFPQIIKHIYNLQGSLLHVQICTSRIRSHK